MGKWGVTIVDVARHVGVSPSTVSLVLRNDPSISPPTVARVKAAIAELGYVYNRGAAALREAESKMVGTVVHDLANETMTEIALGANVALRERGYVQVLGHTEDDVSEQRKIIRAFREYGLRGLVISPARGSVSDDLAEGMTVVQVARDLPDSGLASVRSDNEAGIVAALTHLVDLGHRHIGFVGGRPDTETFRQRRTAFDATLYRLGLPPGVVVETPPTHEGGIEGIAQLLRQETQPTAAVCFNDVVAYGVYDGLRELGLEPGRDVSVVGFDDIPTSRRLYPALTSVSIDPRSMGTQAVALLIDLMNGSYDGPTQILTPVSLVVRGSTNPPSSPG